VYATLKIEVVLNLGDGGTSGKPSKKCNVPSRVSTLSGGVMAVGMSVVIFIFGVCPSLHVTAICAVVFIFKFLQEYS
jgi:hypothetical protein